MKSFIDEPSRSFIDAFNRKSLVHVEIAADDMLSSDASSSVSNDESSESSTESSADDSLNGEMGANEEMLDVRLWRYFVVGLIVLLGTSLIIGSRIVASEGKAVAFAAKVSGVPCPIIRSCSYCFSSTPN